MLDFSPDVYEKLFSSLDNNAVIMRVEDDGTYYPVWCSDEFTQMMECTQEDFFRLENASGMNTIHPDDRGDVAYLFCHHKARNGANRLTFRKRTVTGKTIWVCVHYSFFKDKGIQYVYCTYFDVTELKAIQEQTKAMYDELNDELSAIANESLVAIRSNLSTGIAEEVHGKDLYDADKAGAAIKDLMDIRLENMPIKSDRDAFLAAFAPETMMQRYSRGENTVSLVLFSRRQSGRQCFIKYSASIRKDPATGDMIFLGIETEYNSQKVTEALNQKVLKQQYDMVCYIIGDNYGVVIGDADETKKGNIFPKKRYGIYTDYIKEQVLPAASERSHDLSQLEKALSHHTVCERLEESEPYIVDVTCDYDGELYYKRFSFFVIDREARFYILLKTDVTDVIKEQHTQNELLRAALEEANHANAAKTAFLSSMSHEIRTPMNAIIGLDSIALTEPELPEHTREHLEKIGASAHHLLALINDILDMSRIESGRMMLKHEEFSFGGMLEQINTMINSQCGNKGLHYDCVITGKIDAYYIGDDMKLKQVLINILGNAVKFTPAPGNVTLSVSKTASYNDKSTIRFIISDTGIGIDEKFLPRIFDAFSQENSNTADKYGSTGLGMAITKNIVEMMNGNISVTSEKGKGTVFTVNVTLGNSSRKSDLSGTMRPQDMHVLVIDDDAVACEHAKLVLGDIGISADSALSGAEGIEMVKLSQARFTGYDLILVDLRMPGLDGIDTTRTIRKIIGSDSAIMILTAYSWDDVEEEAKKAGIDSFISKPLFASRFMDELSSVIGRKQLRRDVQKHRAQLAGRRILLAEDVQINAEIIKRLLKMKDMQCEHGINGKIVYDMFREKPEGYYDAVLMDVRMPEMNGLEAAEAIRALAAQRSDAASIPIIALTANAFDEDVQHTMQAGMNAHLSKPVEPEKLYETLELLIAD